MTKSKRKIVVALLVGYLIKFYPGGTTLPIVYRVRDYIFVRENCIKIDVYNKSIILCGDFEIEEVKGGTQ